ncbi:MAG: hypothetical protein JNG89_19775 [Planctomycetaceae bacterium]|nr:hypothetical protein [Planctomycetaceae bacterium]
MQAVVISFEHLAAWSLGCYGNTWIRTPRFDRLAAHSVVFDQCYALPQAVERYAGLSRLAADVREDGGAAIAFRQGDGELSAALADWRQAVARHEHALLWLQFADIASPWSAPSKQLGAAWPAVCDAEALFESLAVLMSEPPDRSVSPDGWLDAAIPQLMAGGYLDRAAIAATPAIGRLRRIVYAAAVMGLDAKLGQVLDMVQAEADSDALLIVTATGGDLAGPHAQLSSGCPSLIEPLVHVPLLVRTGTQADGTRRNALTTLEDIVPTLSELFHVKHDATSGARSLWPVLRDEIDEVRAELLLGSRQLGWSLRTKDFACLCGPQMVQQDGDMPVDSEADRPRLFVKPDDAWDTLDVASQYPEVTARMLDTIQSEVGSDLHQPRP